ncbi:MAG: HAD-IC family P-type ATPase [Patescibacteria group bacterium]|nr:HAD-IC family P-type ATPase [Patescibacteria group bacterium]
MDERTQTDLITPSPHWSNATDDVIGRLHTRPGGLTQDEAEQRLKLFGKNEIALREYLSKTKILLNQFKSPLIAILLFAGLLTIALGEWIDASVILAAVGINAALGFWQEHKAGSVLQSLMKYVRVMARVRRDGRDLELDAARLVPGDVIRISQGDRIPADCRLIYVNGLEIDESIITGESLPVKKTISTLLAGTPLAERTNMAMSGSLAVQGFGDAIVTATGHGTEFSRIAALASGTQDAKTPLQKAVSDFALRASMILAGLTSLLFIIGLAQGHPWLDMLLISVAIAISAVPEGLPVALTVILAVGVERLAKRGGIVRKLLAAETLGSTNLILTDKTGTLTQASMSISAVLPFKDQGKEAENRLLRDALLDTDVVIENPENKPTDWRMAGKPLETSLVRDAALRGISLPEILRTTTEVDRVPFNSSQKFSAVAVRRGTGFETIVLGAPDIILEYTDLPSDTRATILKIIDEHARSGERILGVASRQQEKQPRLHDMRFSQLTFRGLIALRDPLRPDVKEEISKIEKAGVRTVIVTGDHAGTAIAVAQELDILDADDLVLTGSELGRLAATEIETILPKVRVFARVTPEQKLQIVRAYQKIGYRTAVTGDGVNDAPALQAADIGVAVGAGTEVAKSAADLIILNNDFATIVAAIEEGRRLAGNINKAIIYLLSNASNELVLITGTMLLNLPIPLTALQILYINMFSDSLPAVAFAFEKNRDGILSPRNADDPVLNREMKFFILIIGTLTSILLFVLYLLLRHLGAPHAFISTFIYATFGTYTLFAAFSLRSLKSSIFTYNPFSNIHLTAGVAVGLALTVAGIYLPFMQKILGTVPLPLEWFLAVLAVGAGNVAMLELGKYFLRPKHPTKKLSASKMLNA